MYRGWYQVAFERELGAALAPARIGDLRLALARTRDGWRAYDAACPHRGADLARGGTLEDGAVVCPFHGRRIGLGEESGCSYRVRGYRTLCFGGLVFILLAEEHDHGFAALLTALDRTHHFVPGFSLSVRAAPELVIENGFDSGHFKSVHNLASRPDLRLRPGKDGELAIEGIFRSSSANSWQQGDGGAAATETRFFARVFSPNLCLTQLGEGDGEFMVLSGATPEDGGCLVRVSLLVPAGRGETAEQQRVIRTLLRDSKLAYEQDRVIWENMVPAAPSHFAPDDDLVLAFHRFCAEFLQEVPWPASVS